VRNLPSFETSLNFEPPAFENAERYTNSETKLQWCDDRFMSCPKFGEVGFIHSWESSVSCDTPPKITRRKRAKSSITQPWIIWCHSNFVWSLNSMTPEILQKFKVKRSKVKVTGWH